MKAILPALIIVLFATIVTGRAGSNGSPDLGGVGPAATAAAERPRNWLAGSRCTVLADAPVRDRTADRVLGPAHYRCDAPGAGVQITVSLQRRGADGTWTTIASRPGAAGGADTTRQRRESERTVTATATCADGTYRTHLRGTVTIDGTGRTVENISVTSTNPCRSMRAR